jgi:hypothetical protein
MTEDDDFLEAQAEFLRILAENREALERGDVIVFNANGTFATYPMEDALFSHDFFVIDDPVREMPKRDWDCLRDTQTRVIEAHDKAFLSGLGIQP